jgi:uncharacterized protein YpbB
MTITVKKTIVVEKEVDVQLPLFWKLDNWFHKIEHNYYLTLEGEEFHKYQLTSVTGNCISKTLMTLDQFAAYYGHYNKLYEKITEQEFVTEFDKLNNYLK